jgi:xanthine/CO dehydrogenase XdhC/CoxF family maturation factor
VKRICCLNDCNRRRVSLFAAPDTSAHRWRGSPRFAGYHTTLIDDRADFLKRERFPEEQIELIVATDWSSACAKRSATVAVCRWQLSQEVTTKTSSACKSSVRANPDYVGLIGSKRRTSIVIDRLRESGRFLKSNSKTFMRRLDSISVQ